jgi:hypothetical protein
MRLRTAANSICIQIAASTTSMAHRQPTAEPLFMTEMLPAQGGAVNPTRPSLSLSPGETPVVGRLDVNGRPASHLPWSHSTTEKSAQPTERHAPHCPPKTSVLTPLHLCTPLSTRLDEISLPLGVPSNPFLAHFALLVPPEALCSPATSPKFSTRCPSGARLAPATGRAPRRCARHFLGRRSAAPAEQPAPPGRRSDSAALAAERGESPRKA